MLRVRGGEPAGFRGGGELLVSHWEAVGVLLELQAVHEIEPPSDEVRFRRVAASGWGRSGVGGVLR